MQTTFTFGQWHSTYQLVNLGGWQKEVDLEYPQELHNLHNDYPVAPEKAKVSLKNMLLGYCKKICRKK